MVRFLDPETAEILQFLDPEIVKMDKTISGSRNRRNGEISGSRNRRKGRQILYGSSSHAIYLPGLSYPLSPTYLPLSYLPGYLELIYLESPQF